MAGKYKNAYISKLKTPPPPFRNIHPLPPYGVVVSIYRFIMFFARTLGFE